ncbi:MAG: hypothetical protein H5T63_02000, partial [Chloroflexi bacterium]|nr:hypothetical protein [Chloroflexota bacterium]
MARAVAGIGGLVNAYFGALCLGPVAWGTWQAAKLVLQYGANLHLGVQNGMHREIPILRGKGDLDGQRRIAQTTFTFTFIAAALTAVAILAAA